MKHLQHLKNSAFALVAGAAVLTYAVLFVQNPTIVYTLLCCCPLRREYIAGSSPSCKMEDSRPKRPDELTSVYKIVYLLSFILKAIYCALQKKLLFRQFVKRREDTLREHVLPLEYCYALD